MNRRGSAGRVALADKFPRVTLRSMPAHRPYRHGNLRDAVLEAARSMVSTDGTAGLSLRAPVREIGASHKCPTSEAEYAHHQHQRSDGQLRNPRERPGAVQRHRLPAESSSIHDARSEEPADQGCVGGALKFPQVIVPCIAKDHLVPASSDATW